MKITLDQQEIELAIINHVKARMYHVCNKATVVIKATRGEEGMTALIDIDENVPPSSIPSTPLNRSLDEYCKDDKEDTKFPLASKDDLPTPVEDKNTDVVKPGPIPSKNIFRTNGAGSNSLAGNGSDSD